MQPSQNTMARCMLALGTSLARTPCCQPRPTAAFHHGSLYHFTYHHTSSLYLSTEIMQRLTPSSPVTLAQLLSASSIRRNISLVQVIDGPSPESRQCRLALVMLPSKLSMSILLLVGSCLAVRNDGKLFASRHWTFWYEIRALQLTSTRKE